MSGTGLVLHFWWFGALLEDGHGIPLQLKRMRRRNNDASQSVNTVGHASNGISQKIYGCPQHSLLLIVFRAQRCAIPLL